MDELAAANCVAFTPYGDKIFAGKEEKRKERKWKGRTKIIKGKLDLVCC